MMRKYLAIILIALTFNQCSSPSSVQRDGFFIKDMLARKVLVPNSVNRIVCLRAGTLRLYTYVNGKELIVGIEEPEQRSERTYLEAYPDLKKLPVIGPAMGGDPELILTVNPDIIFISYTTVGDADRLQEQTGIPVIAIECAEMATKKEKLYESMHLMGKITHRTNRVDSLIQYIEKTISDLNDRTKHKEKNPTSYISGISYSGSYGISSTQPWYPPFIFTNTYNVASEIDKSLISHVKGTFIDTEQLMIWNPDHIFIDGSGLGKVSEDFQTKSILKERLKAYKDNNMYVLHPFNNYATNYEMVLLNAWYVGTVLYPEKFMDISFEEKSMEILSTFFFNKSGFDPKNGYYRKLNKAEL